METNAYKSSECSFFLQCRIMLLGYKESSNKEGCSYQLHQFRRRYSLSGKFVCLHWRETPMGCNYRCLLDFRSRTFHRFLPRASRICRLLLSKGNVTRWMILTQNALILPVVAIVPKRGTKLRSPFKHTTSNHDCLNLGVTVCYFINWI